MVVKIPNQTKKFSITNRSDTTGNIWYTKNIDLSEEGYIKQSPRAVQVFSDSSLDVNFDTDFNIVSSIGRYGVGGGYYLASNEEPFLGTLSQTSLSITQDTDTGHQVFTQASRGRWYQNAWHVSTDTAVYSKAISTGTWTSIITSLTSSITHPIEIFRNRNTIVVGNGNVVKQYTSAYASYTDLTIPTDYEVVDICYSNNKVGIITKLSATAVGQNQEAFFFVWDGASTTANAGFPIGDIEIASITAYKSSWAILSKSGQILYFNGGGFQELAVFPFFSKDRIWDTSSVRGDIMITDGDLIYIHLDGVLNINGSKQQTVLQNNQGGIWCYDPAVGLYHKYSPSISQLSLISVADSNVDISTDLLTVSSGTIPTTGSAIKLIFSTANPIGGLVGGDVYYVIKVSPTTFRLATTKTNAVAGTYINLTSIGASTNYFLALLLKDYSQGYLTVVGAIAKTDTKNVVYDGLTISHRCANAVGTQINYFGMLVSGFDNISYIVTPKIESQEIEDNIQKIFIKHKLLKATDSIIVKTKSEEVIGIPVSTPLRSVNCTWASTSSLTLAGDVSEVLTYLSNSSKECELEVIGGSGAGQMAQISTIVNNAGTYTITLEDEIEGVTIGDTCNIIIDNWRKIGIITSSDTLGYKQFSIQENTKSIKFKIILKGSNIVIEELQFINKNYLKSQ